MLLRLKKALHFLLVLFIVPKRNVLKLIKIFIYSRSQLNQDLFVLGSLGLKKDGYFVEFGACDGEYLSNTLLLEEKFNWSGILSEPCKNWHDDLKKKRYSIINTNCVWSSSGKELVFHENSNDKALSGSLQNNVSNESYPVISISLTDLLISNGAPAEVDFISIDTEGTELEILKEFDFKKFKVKIWCVEHNYNKDKRKAILELFSKNGYKRIPTFFTRFDDWYVKS